MPEHRASVNISEPEFMDYLRNSQTVLPDALAVPEATPLFTEIDGGKQEWAHHFEKISPELLARRFGKSSLSMPGSRRSDDRENPSTIVGKDHEPCTVVMTAHRLGSGHRICDDGCNDPGGSRGALSSEHVSCKDGTILFRDRTSACALP